MTRDRCEDCGDVGDVDENASCVDCARRNTFGGHRPALAKRAERLALAIGVQHAPAAGLRLAAQARRDIARWKRDGSISSLLYVEFARRRWAEAMKQAAAFSPALPRTQRRRRLAAFVVQAGVAA